MSGELPWLLGFPALLFFIALPALGAWRRRRESREASEVAAALAEFAGAVRAAGRCLPLDELLRTRIVGLRVAESASLQLAQELEHGGPSALADAAQRLAQRLRRRVCFERKMLARTAPGLRRGAIVASLPLAVMLALHAMGADLPAGAQLVLLLVEALGCGLLHRLARVEI